jgi:hypothetical protein
VVTPLAKGEETAGWVVTICCGRGDTRGEEEDLTSSSSKCSNDSSPYEASRLLSSSQDILTEI